MTDPDRDISPQILPMGLDGLVVRFSLVGSPRVTAAVQRFHDSVDEANISGVREVAAGLTSVLIKFDPQVVPRARLTKALNDLIASLDLRQTALPKASRRWHIPVQFGGVAGPQLREAASMAGCSEAQAIDDVIGADLRVLTIGFAPGQPYIGMLPSHWNLPRQTELTPQVPAGALVVAVRQLVLFANPSVTGWRQIGCCAFRPFLARRSEPFALKQGDALRFVQVSEGEMTQLSDDNSDGLGGARCEVLL